jgi:hypothetical protein
MRRYTAQWIYPVFWILGVAALQACAPLTEGSNTSNQNCLAAVVQNSGAIGIGRLNVSPPAGTFIGFNTIQLAQSFKAASTTTISTVSLNLDSVVPTGTQSQSTIEVDIEPDMTISTTGVATATAPAGIGSSLGSSTVAASTILTTTTGGPSFISFPISAALTQGQIYWLVATPGYTPNATTYVEWRYSTIALLNQLADYFSTLSWITVSTSINYDFKVGC